jgi:ADP-ribose pyrophosphatase YjhB (NUDIX family)
MRLGATGIVINEFGEVLLMQRDDTRTFAPPGGAVEAGELPTDSVVREVAEETGLKVYPVRLVGLYYLQWGDTGFLNFVFRCIQRGGELATSVESLQVGFYPMTKLPSPMPGFTKARLEKGFLHKGGSVYWEQQQDGLLLKIGRVLLTRALYPWRNWQRKRRDEPVFIPPPEFKVGAFTVIRNEDGAVLWVKRGDVDFWNLPGGGGLENEAPWQTAVRETREETGLTVTLSNLTSVHVYENEAHIALTFTAVIQSGVLTTGPESIEFAWFIPGEEPENSFAQHRIRAAEAVGADEVTQFGMQSSKTPSPPYDESRR